MSRVMTSPSKKKIERYIFNPTSIPPRFALGGILLFSCLIFYFVVISIMLINDKEYFEILGEIKARIREAQRNAVLSVNFDQIVLYWNIGRKVNAKSEWGNKFVENLERDIRLEFPKAKGFSASECR